MTSNGLIRRSCHYRTLALFGILGILPVAHTQPPSKVSPQEADNMVCGPQCVKIILEHYGQDVELLDLVKEIQWPDLSKGASLASLEAALNKRGVYTQAVQTTPDAELTWPYPVLVHLNVGKIGHYVVWKPSENPGIVSLEGPLDGITMEAWRSKRSGFALLTSPIPITNPLKAANSSQWAPATLVIGMTTAIAGIGLMFFLRFKQRPSPVPATNASPKTQQ